MPTADAMTVSVGAGALERNLAALVRGSPDTAARVRLAGRRSDAHLVPTDDGVPAIEIVRGGTAVSLCSRRRPLDEARRLIEPVEIADAAIFVVVGFGAGYHIAELARRVGKTGLIVVFEPDVELLRTALEAIDHSAWMSRANVAVLTDPDDAGAMSAAVQGLEGLAALGVTMLAHPASEARLGGGGVRKRFEETFNRLVEALALTARTSVFQAKVTLRNLIQNAEHYALRPGAAQYKGVFKGLPAVVVAAGPSLERNIGLLSAPGVRDRVVIVAVQTVLKPLLARGVRPHFVTALDYSELSLRFYEGLTADDVRGITLVVEPKVNRAVTDAFPGELMCADDKHLALLLGPGLIAHRAQHGEIVPCATVAHLAYHWARFIGCDPVALIGQDLGFTDGAYYASGAAIHDTWASELNEFNTLEMLEWQRIKRMGPQLMPTADSMGRPIYTDRQMSTYRVQFERDFRADAERGLHTLDCTEGGVAKGHTRPLRLSEFLSQCTATDVRRRMSEARSSATGAAPATRAQLKDRLRAIRKDVWRIAEASRTTAVLLSEMSEHHADQSRVNRLIKKVYAARDEVLGLEPAFTAVQLLDQKGGLNRIRADRALGLDAALTPLERQRRQIERDVENVRSLAAAADDLGQILDEEVRALDGAARNTRDADVVRHGADAVSMSWAESGAKLKVGAIIAVTSADLGAGQRELASGLTVLGATLHRLARCSAIDGITLVCQNESRLRAAMGTLKFARAVRVVEVAGELDSAPAFVRSARLFAGACWRAGLGGASVFDEALAPRAMSGVMEQLELDAALVVGATWCSVDPGLCDEAIRRHAQNPEQHRFTFAHAAPGLAGCVLSRRLMADLAGIREQAGALGTLGAMLGYLPPAPTADPLGSRVCVAAGPAVRDAGERYIADSTASLEWMVTVARSLGNNFIASSAAEVVASRAALLRTSCPPPPGPAETTLLIGTMGTAPWRENILAQLGALRDDSVLTIAGSPRRTHGQPREEVLHDPALPTLVRAARAAGVRGVHVRTGLRATFTAIDQLLAAAPDIISVDLLAETPGVYGAVAGEDAMALAWAGMEHIMRRRGSWPRGDGSPSAWRGWLVPRMTKCDAAYPEMERFYDRWIMLCGWAVIDPMLAAVDGERIAPLRTPRSKAVRDARASMTVQVSGAVLGPDGAAIGDVSREPVAAVWERLWESRRNAGLL